MGMTLYELTDEFLALLEMAEDPEISPDVLADTMEAIQGEYCYKAESYAKVIRSIRAEATAYKSEIDRMTKIVNRLTENADRMSERLKNSMEETGQLDIKTDLFHLHVKKNPPSLVIDKPEEIGKEYLIPQPPKIDKSAIKEDLKAGLVLPWCHTEQGTSLSIK